MSNPLKVVAGWLTVAACAPAAVAGAAIEERKEYRDSRGTSVVLPLGDLSFADRVVSFTAGQPAAQGSEFSDPRLALGPPDYVHTDDVAYTTLGCGGKLILEFVDNALVNGPGADLHVFEIGPDVEGTDLAISPDGLGWIEIGKIAGGTASIDIEGYSEPGAVFRFVRLTDLKSACGSSWPGADIDAVAAVGSAVRLSLSSVVLFDFDQYQLKPGAASALMDVAKRAKDFPRARVIIEGHTDSVGTHEYNLSLSERRAAAVQQFLGSELADEPYALEIRAYGETRPIATNDTESGREQNRRVEILILPEAKSP